MLGEGVGTFSQCTGIISLGLYISYYFQGLLKDSIHFHLNIKAAPTRELLFMQRFVVGQVSITFPSS